MPLREWFRPPRHLLVILLLLTVASVSALLWSGWKLTEQESAVEAQRNQERLAQAADRIAALLRANLAETGERLAGAAAASSPAGMTPAPGQSLLLILTEDRLSAYPPGILLYTPIVGHEAEAPEGAFAEGETAEIREQQLDRAAGIYRRLSGSKDRALHAGALMRLARVLRKRGEIEAARTVYERLSRVDGVRVAGAPAELVARHALSDLSRDSTDGMRLQQDLLAGRWALTRGQFEFYWAEAIRLSGHEEALGERTGLTEAAAGAWSEWKRTSSLTGQRTMWIDGRPWFAIWRAASGRQAVLIQRPESILQTLPVELGAVSALVDDEGRIVAGRKPVASAVVRIATESQLPWSLYVTGSQSPRDAGLTARQRFMRLGIGTVVVFLVVGTYFVGRAIRREIAVSKLQSDFVATVSHEFRSPLTVMRQLSEILAFGRVPDEERRQKYYDTLVGETRRLQRLVETLLNFGKLEEGVRQYRFEEIDTGELVEGVVGEFAPELATSGRRIELSRPSTTCPIRADADALALALRNLVDNALKYSPNQPAVSVEWGCEDGAIAIRVRDRGMGIPAAEQRLIFQKFVRGSAAIAANVKGTGVGLAMVGHIVRAHGGEIRVASVPGEGSTFTILLPAPHRARKEGAASP
jgi:signal transduction histidine kinase/predicted negative regulator of RcsB-dependent stress response